MYKLLSKTISGLECCILRDPDDKSRCDACPYDSMCTNRLKNDALMLLTQQKKDIDQLHDGYIEIQTNVAFRLGQKTVALPTWAVVQMIQRLKETSPKIMSPEEVSQMPQGGVIWRETRITNRCVPLIRRGDDFKNDLDFLLLDEVMECEDYLVNYRCWNLQPTEEQRIAMPWKKKEDIYE